MTTSNSPKFEPTDEQKAIIKTDENTIVVANPGTGKTSTLALKVIELEDHAEIAVAENIPRDRRQAIDAVPLEVNLPGIGLVKRGQEVQECAFSRSTLPHDREELSLVHLEIRTAKNRDGDLVLVIGFLQATGGE